MTLVFSIAVAITFGAGCYLLIKHDLVKVVAGIVLIGHASNLFIMTSGLSEGGEAFYPLPADGRVTDPLVQSLTLTAIVITFGVSALLLSLIYRVYQTHQSLDIEALSDVEERLAQAEELEPSPDVAEETADRPESGEEATELIGASRGSGRW